MLTISPDLYPQFPIYVVSKGRSAYMITSKALTAMGVAHYIVVEPQEVEIYQAAIDKLGLSTTVLPLDMSYKDRYETCDEFGTSKSTGAGPARNFAWDHALAAGFGWYWEMDDNIRDFYRLNRNLKVPCRSPAFWRAMEDFVLRYENVGMAGPNYFMFASRKTKMPPFTVNTRIYSCNLIRTDLPFRWRGRYNEDTILSLDLLKGRWATIQFNAFLQEKMGTQVLPGGNTDEIYCVDGIKREKGQRYADGATTEKSDMLVRVHPDVAKVAIRFKRVHHLVDYGRFRGMELRRRPDVEVAEDVNNYGMALRQLPEAAPEA
jgi:hypothetical protein